MIAANPGCLLIPRMAELAAALQDICPLSLFRCNNSGSLAKLTAILRASSSVSMPDRRAACGSARP